MSNDYSLENGSEGSHIAVSENIRKYPTTGELPEHPPTESDKPVAPPEHLLRTASANEVVRRAANRQRDLSRRWGIENAPQVIEERE